MSEATDSVDFEERKKKLDEAVEKEAERMDEQQQNALSALRSAADSDRKTYTVDLTEKIDGADPMEVEVIDTVPGRLERAAAQVRSSNDPNDVGAICDILAHVIQTDGYNDSAVWETLFEEHGSGVLMSYANIALRPYVDRMKEMEDVDGFRS